MAMTPTDRGFALIRQGEQGLEVAVATSVDDGIPDEVYAVHYGVQRIDVGAGVGFVETAAAARRTTRPVAVHARDGVVYLRAAGTATALGAPSLR
jgi:hypothetical protein